MLNPNNVNKLLICKYGKGCLSFGQIFNKCSDYSICESSSNKLAVHNMECTSIRTKEKTVVL